MDCKLSEFITKTDAGPGLARDLLEGHKWDLKSAINAYYEMKGVGRLEVEENISPFGNGCGFQNGNAPGSLNCVAEEGDSVSLTACSTKSTIATTIITANGGGAKCLSEPSLLSSPSSLSRNSAGSSTNSSPSKLAVSKLDVAKDGDIIDTMYPKKLARGISRATDNVTLVSKARSEFAQDFKMSSRGSRLMTEHTLTETPDFTFTLPDLTIHPPDFSEFLEKDLIEKSSLVSLEGAGRLNWWADIGACQRLWPLATSGDGNCLLHAASLGMWGFHDRLLTLRKALHVVLLNSSYKSSFYRRWRWQSSQQNKEAGLILCEEEWEREWETLLKMASTEPRVRAHVDSAKASLNGGKKENNILEADEMQPHIYESLEEVHILALAHVLKRPIIVIADTTLKDVNDEPFAPIPFGGIYLPFECEPSECHISPLCLTYDAAHFSALVAMEMETYADKTPLPPAAIPLTDSEKKLLPVQFAIDPGQNVNWSNDVDDNNFIMSVSLTDRMKLNLLKKYLDVFYLNIHTKEVLLESETFEKSISASRPPVLEKSLTLPSKFEFDSSELLPSGAPSCSPGSSTSADNDNSASPKEEPEKTSKNKATRQLQNLGRRFGSLGRSMSKQIKRNLSNIAKRRPSFRRKGSPFDGENGSKNGGEDGATNGTVTARNGSYEALQLPFNSDDVLVVAALHTEKRHDYHEEMIRNYLNTARLRFLNFQKNKKDSSSHSSSASSSKSSSLSGASITDNYATQCVNTGCKNFGTGATNYLCLSCHTEQKDELSRCAKLTTNTAASATTAAATVSTTTNDFDCSSSITSGINSVNCKEVMIHSEGKMLERKNAAFDAEESLPTGKKVLSNELIAESGYCVTSSS